MVLAEPACCFRQPSRCQAFSSFLGGGEGVALNGNAVLGSAGQNPAQPTKSPWVAKASQQLISNSRYAQLPVFHYYLFTSATTSGFALGPTDNYQPTTSDSRPRGRRVH